MATDRDLRGELNADRCLKVEQTLKLRTGAG